MDRFLPVKPLTEFHTHRFSGSSSAIDTCKNNLNSHFTPSNNCSKTYYMLKPSSKLGQSINENHTKIPCVLFEICMYTPKGANILRNKSVKNFPFFQSLFSYKHSSNSYEHKKRISQIGRAIFKLYMRQLIFIYTDKILVNVLK